MKLLLRISMLVALLASVAVQVGGTPPAAAQSAAYTDTMNSEADGLLSTVSPDPATISFAYQDGTFVMQASNQAAPKEILTDIKTPSMQGAQVLFDVSISGDVNLKYVVVGCRSGPGHSGYQLAVDLDTAEATLRSRDGQYSQVLDRTDEPVALNTGATMNQIGIDCEDTRISAIVNGVTVLTAFDSEYTDGQAYLGVGSRVGASGGLNAIFDNLTVADLGSSGFEGDSEGDHGLAPASDPQTTSDPLFDPLASIVQAAIRSVFVPPVAGPTGGTVDLNPNDGAGLPLEVQVTDFYAELTFVTPQSTPSGLWLYGFCFWTDPAGNCTDLFIQSNGSAAKWGLGSFPANGDYTLLDAGDMPAGSVDLTPGAENQMALLVYDGSAILAANGQVAASFPLNGQPLAGDVVERIEFSANDPAGTQTLTMATHDVAVWDMGDYALSFPLGTSGDAAAAQSMVDRSCRLTEPSADCHEELTS